MGYVDTTRTVRHLSGRMLWYDARWSFSMIVLTLTAPLIGFALMLFMQWLEEHTMTSDTRRASAAKRRG
ncbi:hypothetical protein GCM10028802_20710 [Terrabacter terrigena]